MPTKREMGSKTANKQNLKVLMLELKYYERPESNVYTFVNITSSRELFREIILNQMLPILNFSTAGCRKLFSRSVTCLSLIDKLCP